MSIVAVVGGTGFLGRHVVAALEKAGYAVRVLSRRTGFDALHPDHAALRGATAVVNLAGIKREAGAQTFQAVHVDLVRRLVEAMKTVGVRRLIHISVVVLIAAFACGIFWSWLYAATDNLVATSISHLLWDTILFFVFPVIR